MAAPSGIPFGNYQLLKRIARGGMAEVFLGRQKGPEGFDRLVAVKRVLPHLVDSEDFIRMFFDEARLAANLSHPNCVHIYEFGKVEDHYFIAMEYVDGINAGDLIKWAAKEALPPALVARIGADACAGLHYAHELVDSSGRQLQLVHRDVSPPNLLVSHDGTVKLVDFGIAKAVISVEQTRPGVVKGKYAYMSPEQTTGQPLDGKSDVFSLALVLWELLAGRVAVTREDQVAAMKSIRDGKLPRLEEVRPDVPPPLAEALSRGLELKPQRRTDALEFGLLLEEFIKASPDHGSSLHLAQWVRTRFPRQHPTGEAPRLDGPPGTRPATAATRGAAGMTRGKATTVPGRPHEQYGDGPSVVVSESLGELEDEATEIDESRRSDQILVSFASPEQMAPGDVSMPEPVQGEASLTQLSASVPPAPRPTASRARRIMIAAVASLAVGALVLLAITAGDGRGGSAGAGAVAAELNESERDASTPAGGGEDAAAANAADPDEQDEAEEEESGQDEDERADQRLAIIEIITQPQGAEVTLDDGIPTESPVLFAEVDPGLHEVLIALEGHKTVRRELKVTPGQRRTLDLRLEELPDEPEVREKAELERRKRERERRLRRRPPKKRFGVLKARTRPYSVVYHRGRKLGTTPFANVKLKAGRYMLTFKNPAHPTQRRRVRIRAGKETKLDFALKE